MSNRFPIALNYVRKHTPYKGKKGMSLRDLSIESGVSTPYISQLEQPEQNRTPSREIIIKLATGLAKQTKIDPFVITNFFNSMAGYNKPDPRIALKVSKTLTDTNFKDFLQFIVGYTGTVNLDEPNDDKVANEAFKNWDKAEAFTTKMLLKDYMNLSHKIFLNTIDDSQTKVILDNTQLNSQELIILKNSINTIRQLREDLKK